MAKKLLNLFGDYSQRFKLNWGRIFASSRPRIHEALASVAARHGCRQKIEGEFVLWRRKRGGPAAMFCVLPDRKNPKSFVRIYRKVDKLRPEVTFVIVEQRSDGPGNYDVFRLWNESYMEHNNRARFRPSRK